MAAQLHDTLHQRLLSLPAELEIYPGQAGSACGADLSGKPASSIGFEKRFNPMLSMSNTAVESGYGPAVGGSPVTISTFLSPPPAAPSRSLNMPSMFRSRQV